MLYGGNPDVSMRQHRPLVVYTLIIQNSHFNIVSCVQKAPKKGEY